MGTADIITDVLLVCFPIPIVWRSQMPIKRKLLLVFLFSFSVALIIITGMRMPHVISHHGRQQYRTVWASAEILASAAVSNAVILGSFVRDKGIKKNKYRVNTMDSISRADTRRTMMESYHRDSEEILFYQMGCRMPKNLRSAQSPLPRPAPVAQSAAAFRNPPTYLDKAFMSPADTSDNQPSPHDSADALRKTSSSPPSTGSSGQSVSLYDVGGLLGSGDRRHPSNGTMTHDFAERPTPTRTRTEDILSELGGRLSMSRPRSSQRRVSENREPSRPGRRQSRDSTVQSPSSPTIAGRNDGANSMDLQDIGGLLSEAPQSPSSPRSPQIVPSSRSIHRSTTEPPHRRTSNTADPMDLQDPGGLLK